MVEFPSDVQVAALSSSELLCVDIEGKDPDLIKKGPSTQRGGGYICGVGFGAELSDEKLGFYLPIKHPDLKPEDIERSMKIIPKLLSSNTPKIGANIIYDIEWLEHEGFKIERSELHDVQYAEPLLDEYKRTYSLESLADKYTNTPKRTDVLKAYCDTMGWAYNKTSQKPVSHLWKMPSRVAAEYAIGDVTIPLDIFRKQKMELERQKLWDLYVMETELIPVLLRMRRNGVRLNMPLLHKTIQEVTEKSFILKEQIFDWAGQEFNINSSSQLSKVLDKYGIAYPRNQPTELMRENGKPGNPNLDKVSLGKIAKHHDVCNTILEFRHYDTLINMFLHPYMDLQVGGRLFGSFHPLRSDDYGTVAGRFSASKPNLQQVSAIDEDDDDSGDSALKGKILRALFIPEDGQKWAKLDYSQVEYRIIAHYAAGAGAEDLRYRYNNDPNTDMHQVIMDMTGFNRRVTKRLNFGGTYGMGIPTAAESFGWTMEEAEIFMTGYHTAAPYVKASRNAVSKTAARRGHIFTILGRKARTHPSRKLHSMFNRLIQGSAADVMKKGMVDAEKKGLFDELVLHLTVHDELDVSYKDDAAGNEALLELKETMEQAIKFDVPLVVDCHTGANWAEAD